MKLRPLWSIVLKERGTIAKISKSVFNYKVFIFFIYVLIKRKKIMLIDKK